MIRARRRSAAAAGQVRDGVDPPDPAADVGSHFPHLLGHRVLPGVGHNLPQEAPAEFAAAVLELGGAS